MKKILKMAVASSVAAVLLVAGAATSANAADQTQIDLDALGSLTIHKFEQPIPTVIELRGEALPPEDIANYVPIQGVEFTVTPVNGLAPLNSIFGWEQVSNLSVDEAGVVTSSDSDVTPTLGTESAPLATDADGIASFNNLAVGVYVVQETSPGFNNIIKAAAPFLVTIPMVSDTDGWNYNVHAYPKNSVATFSKDVVAPNGFGLGSEVSWPISVNVPVLPAEDPFTNFVISDTLDSRLAYTGVSSVTLNGAPVDADDYTVTVTGQDVVINFTNYSSLKNNVGTELSLSIDTNVIAVGDGVINNTAAIGINGFSGITNTPLTAWGSLALLKIDDTGAPLAGAQFSIYENIDDANAGTNPVSVNGSTVFTSNAAGEVNVEGLYVTDSVDGQDSKLYFVKEVVAPSGYLLLENVIPYNVVAGGIANAEISEVENFPIPAGTLPTTGANGVLLMLGGGALLAAAGVAVYFVSRRKGAQATN